MTITTLFASTADGDISSTNAVYATARAGSGLATPVSAATELWVGQIIIGSYACYESFLSFDTSSIPDTDIIRSVALDLWLVTDGSSTDFTVRAREYDWGASVTTGDWVPGADLAGLGNSLGDLSSAGIGATGAYKSFSIDGSNQANWRAMAGMKTGTVRLILYSVNHSNNVAPTGDERLVFSSADVVGTGQDPRLTIEHTPGAPPPFQRSTLRVWTMRGRT